MQAALSNGQLRELIAERDYLRQRNINLSESLDSTALKYTAILARLGYDEEGNPFPKDDSAGQPGDIGDQAAVDAAPPAEAAQRAPDAPQDALDPRADMDPANDS